MSPFARDGGALVLLAALTTGFLMVWLSTVLALKRQATRDALLALLVIPAPPLAWRAGMHKRAIALVSLAIGYIVLSLMTR